MSHATCMCSCVSLRHALEAGVHVCIDLNLDVLHFDPLIWTQRKAGRHSRTWVCTRHPTHGQSIAQLKATASRGLSEPRQKAQKHLVLTKR